MKKVIVTLFLGAVLSMTFAYSAMAQTQGGGSSQQTQGSSSDQPPQSGSSGSGAAGQDGAPEDVVVDPPAGKSDIPT